MQFYQPKELPKIMVAPNGVRPMKKDHPKVPITIDEIVNTAKLSYEAGAEAIHFHIRDKNSQHILDANDCSEALIKLNKIVPNMHLQVTTEAVGRYSPDEMRKYAYDVKPPGISIAIRELIPSRNPTDEDIKLYKYLSDEKINVQHICHEPEDIDLLSNVLNKSEIERDNTWCLFVIGHYSGRISYPDNISLFIKKMEEKNIKLDWSICAFGKEEMSCLEKAVSLGGKIRVGFENSLFMPNGEIASDNHMKVDAINKLFKLS